MRQSPKKIHFKTKELQKYLFNRAAVPGGEALQFREDVKVVSGNNLLRYHMITNEKDVLHLPPTPLLRIS